MPRSFTPATGDAFGRNLADLAEVLAHKLRGPLATLQCYTDLLSDTLHTEEQRELVLRIYECGSVLERMLLELQRFSFELKPIPRKVAVKSFVHELLMVVGCESVNVEWAGSDQGCPETLMIDADPILLRQLFLVLLQNAREACPSRQQRIWIRIEIQEEDVRFELCNSGAMEPEAQKRAFEPFFTTKAQNLGLGLAIARRIAEAHDTRLETRPLPEDTCMAFTLRRCR